MQSQSGVGTGGGWRLQERPAEGWGVEGVLSGCVGWGEGSPFLTVSVCSRVGVHRS